MIFNLSHCKPKYYDRDGVAITIEEWASLMENDPSYKVVKQDCSNGILVSTVWMGLNHSFFSGNPIQIFETMVFCDDETDPNHLDQIRYSTEQEALGGHWATCGLVLGNVELEPA